ncbi:hypothetical protein I4I73_11490 [Pseudonocardia sp. KRD-184]|uniref:4-amino-4-deoxy-L-arabinose transferase-like glycosyltransferase n=1 Tax=Pseudonocardia oceani TaxID=2792013 RepID=A0ABS6U9B2_9PSEU|nr:DUF6541 family protein [Pseudonocardia oceani]MBW0089542.1 hypothetical protein [Pseudonocardia oceani]MBW0096608.1 hypothetical protein [Pseudonocardia oceani]MBW0109781.1 hypothetical protein [Pseudonocardia oceani]MBW0123426.1 hypothetical protein [Pseudonocardia oceani]MBW0128807.1 hypothetical protein [Pseudonocardia oceani]
MADLVAAWLPALPAALVAVAWCVLPGLLVTLSLGLRGVLAWGVAPATSVATIAVAAVVASVAGVPWSPVVALAPAVALALLLAAARWGLARLRRRHDAPAAPPPAGDGTAVTLAALAGLTVAALVGAFTVVDGMSLPTALSQTYDAVFHYSAVARIVAEGDASSLTLGTLTSPGAGAAFYPAAWHDLVSLVVLSAGASIPVASNAAAGVVAAVVWPLGCTALVRVVAGPSWAAVAAAPVLATGFIAFPWSLLSFGVLWPNLVGMSLVPAVLAVVVAAVGREAVGALTRTRAVVLLPVLLAGLALGHPSTVFSLAVIAAFPVAWSLVRWLGRMLRAGRWVTAVPVGLVAVVLVTVAVDWLLTSPVFDDVRSFDWAAFETPLGAVRETALGATNSKGPARVVSVVVLVGLIAALWRPGYRWLVPAHLASATLYVLAASSESSLTAAVTAFWYNDSYRLAAMIPVTGVPLAVVGLLAVGAVLARVPGLSRIGAGGLTALAAVAVLVGTGGMYARTHAAFVDDAYLAVPAGRSELVDPAERAFYDRVAAIVPPDAVVAQNPWTGSALLWALTGREVLFPHLTGNWTADQDLIGRHLDEVVDDPATCAVVARSDVRYLLVGNADFWPGDARSREYPGLASPDPRSGFELLASDRFGNALYRVPDCGPAATDG